MTEILIGVFFLFLVFAVILAQNEKKRGGKN